MILKSEVDEKREKLFSYSNFQERVKKVKKINDFI